MAVSRYSTVTVEYNTFCVAMALSWYYKLHTLIPDIYYTLLHTLIADHHHFQCLCSGLLPAAEAVQEATRASLESVEYLKAMQVIYPSS